MSAEVIPIRTENPMFNDWRSRLVTKQDRKGNSEIVDCLPNATTMLTGDAEWAGVLAWDLFKLAIVCRKPPPWFPDDAPTNRDPKREWDDLDGCRVQSWLRRKWGLGVSDKDAYKAAKIVAEANAFDPVIEWYKTLEHDRVPRVDGWMARYLGCEDTEYTRFVGRVFLVSSVARALDPGCKVDTMIILEGPQGLFKSQAVGKLYGPEWFSDTPLDLASKDRFVGLRGLLCHEMAELDGFGRADVSRVKSFLSSASDNYRPPYGQHNMIVKRRCIMVGTVNPPPCFGYLVDATGNRRMLPVTCGVRRAIDLDGIERDREQLWAEAKTLYGAGPKAGGMPWWATTLEEKRICSEQQAERMAGDVWLGKIEAWLHARMGRVTIRDVLGDCLGIETAKQDQGAATRAGRCLAQLDWEVVARDGGGSRERHYARKVETTEPVEPDPAEAWSRE